MLRKTFDNISMTFLPCVAISAQWRSPVAVIHAFDTLVLCYVLAMRSIWDCVLRPLETGAGAQCGASCQERLRSALLVVNKFLGRIQGVSLNL